MERHKKQGLILGGYQCNALKNNITKVLQLRLYAFITRRVSDFKISLK